MDEGFQTPFGELLRDFRRRAGLTQEELAAKAGLSADAIGLLERGERRRPQRHTLDGLTAALELPQADRDRLLGAGRIRPERPKARPLPAMVTEFVGRAEEIAATAGLLTKGTRLLTLHGPGGVGKTRLALQVADRVAGEFGDGVAFVSLAELRAPSQVAPELIRSLGLRERAGRTAAERAAEYLRGRHMLVVIDNFEHLPEAAPLLADLLAACPRTSVLVTSRAPLRLTAEQRFPVPALWLPDAAERPPFEELVRLPAVEIFAQRARAVLPDFELTPGNVDAVVAICRRLDGLPLAIELAAPWLRMVSPAALVARLDQRLELLSDGALDMPARHRTLRETLAWSHELLSERQRELLAGLSVFIGGCTEEAARAVAGASLPDLAALVDSSMLLRQPGPDAPRFRMLETVRQYAAERLKTGSRLRRAHAEYYLEMAKRAELIGPAENLWKRRLSIEDANLQAAAGHALETGDLEMSIRFARELWRFWSTTGRLTEGNRWLEATVELAERAEPPPAPLLKAELLLWTATLARMQGRYDRAKELYRACLALRPQVGNADTMAAATHNLGIVLYEEGDHEEAARLQHLALANARRTGSGYGVPYGLVTLGDVERARGDTAAATACFQEGLELFRRMGHALGVAQALAGLGHLAHDDGELEQAGGYFREGLELTAGLRDPVITDCLEGLARTSVARGEMTAAVEFLAAAETMREQIGATLSPRRQADRNRLTEQLQTSLDPDIFQHAWRRGTDEDTGSGSLARGAPRD